MARGPKGERRPADVIGAAVKVMRIATGEEPAGLTDRLMEMADLIRLIDNAEIRATVQKRVAALALPQSN